MNTHILILKLFKLQEQGKISPKSNCFAHNVFVFIGPGTDTVSEMYKKLEQHNLYETKIKPMRDEINEILNRPENMLAEHGPAYT